LDTPRLKLFNILSMYYLFMFPQISSHLHAFLVQQIKRINNLLVLQVFKVILRLKLYTLIFRVPLTSLGSVVHTIISFLWIIIPNIYCFIQCLQNLLFLAFSPNLKCLLKNGFSPPSKLCTRTMVGNF
jgi:hypothetical protein